MSSATSQPADGGPTPTERLARRYGSGHRTVARTPRRGPSGRGWILIAAALGPILTDTAMVLLLTLTALAVLPPVEPAERVTLLDVLERK